MLESLVRRVSTPADRVGTSPGAIGVDEVALPLKRDGKHLLRPGGAEQERLVLFQCHLVWGIPRVTIG
jgi:hypothetical protein